MVMEQKFTRREVLGMTAGLLKAATLGPAGAALAQPNAAGRLIRPDRVGTILYTQRDVPSRAGIWNNPSPTMGYLGGPNFPDDPNDLGPLVPLPGGFLELFEFLAECGFKQVEFAGYNQHAANRGGANPGPGNPTAYLEYAKTLRKFLDDTGLEAIGNHGFIPNTWPGGPGGGMSQADYDRFHLELEFASILGMPYMGTGGDPTSSRHKEDWDVAAEKWEALNELARPYRIKIYPHNHADAYNFLLDGPMVEVTEDLNTGQPLPQPQIVRSSSGKRMMQYYLDITNRNLCVCEIDIYWAYVAQHRFQWYYNENGERVQDILDPIAQIRNNSTRYHLYHAKDGERTTQPPGVGNGYNMIPFGDPRSAIPYKQLFMEQRAHGLKNPNYEQDNAPGGAADPGQSLRFAKISARNMMALNRRT